MENIAERMMANGTAYAVNPIPIPISCDPDPDPGRNVVVVVVVRAGVRCSREHWRYVGSKCLKDATVAVCGRPTSAWKQADNVIVLHNIRPIACLEVNLYYTISDQ